MVSNRGGTSFWTTPPFMTNTTRRSAVMSDSGSPSTAIEVGLQAGRDRADPLLQA